MADAFAQPIERAHQDLQNQFHDKVDVPPSRRFVGLDAYEKAIAAGPDIVLLCTPPGFRPAQFAAAVKAGKHVFLEKPVAVDAPGYYAGMEEGHKYQPDAPAREKPADPCWRVGLVSARADLPRRGNIAP